MVFISRKSLRNTRPVWVDDNDPLFITLCHKRRGVNSFDNPKTWDALVASAEHLRLSGKWSPILLLAMPDHLHGLCRISRRANVTQVLGEFKRDLSYRIKTAWQKGSFDHRIRSHPAYWEKLDYILMNPVRAGYVTNPLDWPYTCGWRTAADELPLGVKITPSD